MRKGGLKKFRKGQNLRRPKKRHRRHNNRESQEGKKRRRGNKEGAQNDGEGFLAGASPWLTKKQKEKNHKSEPYRAKPLGAPQNIPEREKQKRRRERWGLGHGAPIMRAATGSSGGAVFDVDRIARTKGNRASTLLRVGGEDTNQSRLGPG